MNLRKILRLLSKSEKGKVKLREILFKYRNRLGEFDFKLLDYCFLYCHPVDKIANSLCISNSLYHIKLNNALCKLEALIDDNALREIVENL